MVTVLGIETSCDETAVAVVRDDKTILFNQIISQSSKHAIYGGVVPEVASRSHLDYLDYLLDYAFTQSNLSFDDIDVVAVTAGPGLIGGVLVGVMYAKAIAATLNKKIIAVNHLEGHALTVRLLNDVSYPFLLLLVSGGHSQLLLVQGVNHYIKLGTTLDDALGEVFDKVAKMLGLGYPGGPMLEKRALRGNKVAYKFPRPLIRQGLNFSFSGLKTAVLRQIEKIGKELLTEENINDICASFQEAVKDVLCDKLTLAMLEFESRFKESKKTLVVAGGVAANKFLGNALHSLAVEHHFDLYIPPVSLCGDNAAMIAWAGVERYQANLFNDLNFKSRSRWDLSLMKDEV